MDANTLLLKRISPLLPPEYDALAGTMTGRVTLLREKQTKADYRNDVQFSANIQSGAFRAAQVREPVTGVNGSVFTNNQSVTTSVTADFAGAKLRVAGTGYGFTKPIVTGHVSGENLQLQRQFLEK